MDFIRPEILSPVGSYDSLQAAVRAGADAVYFGAKHFSARRNAENFDEAEIREAVSFCHIRGVKVYLTLNIMIKQSEIEEALHTARTAYACGVDALIIQDIGIADVIHKAIPQMELHASTQMSVHSPAALPLLKAIGFSRVVAGREMSKQELEAFCLEAKKHNIEVEVFVHGALCMCVSGQCLLSSVLGARSGNRGLCAGPCRLPFEAKGGTGYDLSLKDLSLIDHIKELKEMGVASLKIEGRMKRPEYVAAATAVCRSAVDGCPPETSVNDALKNVFSRSGFTDGYFTGRIGKDMFGIRTKDDVAASKETFSALHELYRAERQSVPVDISAEILKGKPVSVSVSDGINTAVSIGDVPEVALKTPLDEPSVIQSLSKLGATPYLLNSIDVSLDDNLFVRGAQLNELRRAAVEELNQKRAVTERILPDSSFEEIVDVAHGKTPKIIARFENTEQVPEDLAGVSAVILPIDDALSYEGTEITLIAEAPRYITDEKKLSDKFEQLRHKGIKSVYCGNLSALMLAKAAKLDVIAATGLNVCNSHSISVLDKIGVSAVTLSAEISMRDAVCLPSELKKGIFAYGRLPLMLLKNCPVKNGRSCAECDRKGRLTDRKGIEFPVFCRNGYTELFNSTPLYLADKKEDMAGLDYMLLYFTDESAEGALKIIKQYIHGGQSPAEYTRGLYYRDLI